MAQLCCLFAATRPLLRQIENLQSTYSAQTASYERVEKNLTERLSKSSIKNFALSVGTFRRVCALHVHSCFQSSVGGAFYMYLILALTLTDEAQMSLATAQEKERLASEQLMEVSARVAGVESQLTSLKQERSRLAAQLEMERTKIEVLEDAKTK